MVGGLDGPAVLRLAAHDESDEREVLVAAMENACIGLALPHHEPPVITASALRDETARDVVEARITPLDGGHRLCAIHDALVHLSPHESRELGLAEVVLLVDELFWAEDVPRGARSVEDRLRDECVTILAAAR